jgi:hypothetical protein
MFISGFMPFLKWLKTYNISRFISYNLRIKVLRTSLLIK